MYIGLELIIMVLHVDQPGRPNRSLSVVKNKSIAVVGMGHLAGIPVAAKPALAAVQAEMNAPFVAGGEYFAPFLSLHPRPQQKRSPLGCCRSNQIVFPSGLNHSCPAISISIVRRAHQPGLTRTWVERPDPVQLVPGTFVTEHQQPGIRW